jgi:pSer/pThr/pTyr-binding forkhead associated (FHA) protein
MALRFRVLPSDDTRPAGRLPAAAPLVARDVELPDGLAEVRLGRRADVELPLPFAVLSGVHARLARTESGWVAEDLGSTNGTWVDGARLAPGERRPVAPGAELRLATVCLRFEGAGPAAPESHGTATIARRLVDDLFGGGAAAPAIRVVRGAPPAALSLVAPGRAYVAGRAEGCALCLPVEEVSREHAAFVRGADGVVVRDLGSKNGVVVAGARVAGERALADGDLVIVGPVTLTLDDPASRYLRELADMSAESVALAEPVAPPEPAAAPPTPALPPPEPVRPRTKIGTTQLVIGLAVSVLLLLAVAAGVLVFARG